MCHQIHHFEITTKDLHQCASTFRNTLGFQVFAHKTDEAGKEAIGLHLHSIVVVLQSIESYNQQYNKNSEELLPSSDWISNVAFFMSFEEFQKTYTTAHRSGAKFVSVQNDVKSKHNRSFVLFSPFPQVYHTVMEGNCDCSWLASYCHSFKSSELFTDTCFPGFTVCPKLMNRPCEDCNQFIPCSSSLAIQLPLCNYVDHVTFACNTMTSSSLLKWYSKCLGFSESILVNTEENKGFIVEGDKGMRLSAMQYWICSEVGLQIGDFNKPFQIIFAEPLHQSSANQIQTFIDNNGGPGVQHIAFHTENIVQAVSSLMENGLSFITPPSDYYTIIERDNKVQSTKENLELLKDKSILIDVEQNDSNPGSSSSRYLLQVFSHSLFEQNTFFIELITRKGGAKGFGAGNISALWKALDTHFKRF